MKTNKHSNTGVSHNEESHGDYYTGRRVDLIAAGVAMPAWFPSAQQFDRFGRVRRSFTVEHDGAEIQLRDQGRDRWNVYRPIPEEQAEKREAEQKKERVREQRRRLEQYGSDDLGPWEFQLIGWLRSMSRGRSDAVYALARESAKAEGLDSDSKRTERAKPVTRGGLRLVVDNVRGTP